MGKETVSTEVSLGWLDSISTSSQMHGHSLHVCRQNQVYLVKVMQVPASNSSLSLPLQNPPRPAAGDAAPVTHFLVEWDPV